MARIPLTSNTVKRLFALSGNVCAFPSCNVRLVEESGIIVGEICHIEAAEPGGPRFNPKQSDDKRRDFSNLILLCANHHRFTDGYDFGVQKLQKMKASHERRFLFQQYNPPDKVIVESVRRLVERPQFHAARIAVFSLLQLAYPYTNIYIYESDPCRYYLDEMDMEVFVAPIQLHHRRWQSEDYGISGPYDSHLQNRLEYLFYSSRCTRKLQLFLLFEQLNFPHSHFDYGFRQFRDSVETAAKVVVKINRSRDRPNAYLFIATFDNKGRLAFLEERDLERVFAEFRWRDYSGKPLFFDGSKHSWYNQLQEKYRREGKR